MALNELYQEIILDHAKFPRYKGKLHDATHDQLGLNPLCGDEVKIYLKLQNDMIDKISFEGKGCAICMASTSLMIDSMQNKSINFFNELFKHFHDLVTTGKSEKEMGKLFALGGVSEFPIRVKCATLAWHTLHAALSNHSEVVSTESL